MKKKKGFVLVESIVAAVFVLGLSTFLIMNIIPLVGEYEKTLNYDSVDAKYDAHLIRKMILMDDACNVESILSFGATFNNKPKYYYFEGDDICNFLSHKKFCRNLLSPDYLDVKEIIMTEYKADAIKKLDDIEYDRFSRQMQDYLKYMPTYDGINSFYQFRNRIIVTFNDGTATNIELLRPYSSTSCSGGGGPTPSTIYVNVSANPSTWTNQDVTITGTGQAAEVGSDAYAFSENSPLSASDAQWIYMSTTKELFTKTNKVSKNSKYFFNLKDTSGNLASEQIVIDYIDKKKPTCTVSGNTVTCKDTSDANYPASYISGYAVGTAITESSPTTSVDPVATFTKTLSNNEKMYVIDRAGNKSDVITVAGVPQHKVTYNCSPSKLIGHGSGTTTQLTYNEGDSVDLSLVCSNTSTKRFNGWKTTGSKLTSLTMGTSDITLNAVWVNIGSTTCHSAYIHPMTGTGYSQELKDEFERLKLLNINVYRNGVKETATSNVVWTKDPVTYQINAGNGWSGTVTSTYNGATTVYEDNTVRMPTSGILPSGTYDVSFRLCVKYDGIAPVAIEFTDSCRENGENVINSTLIYARDNPNASGMKSISVSNSSTGNTSTSQCDGTVTCNANSDSTVLSGSQTVNHYPTTTLTVTACDVAGNCTRKSHTRTNQGVRRNNRWYCS